MGVACEHCGVTCPDPCTAGWTKCVYYRGRKPSQRPDRHQVEVGKPHRGTIENWGVYPRSDDRVVLGLQVIGEMNGTDVMTTTVRGQDGDEIETLNNRYTLGAKHP